ncbi:MAG: cyclic nucleotide-binding domain-containing protein [Chloroflexota bacterium]
MFTAEFLNFPVFQGLSTQQIEWLASRFELHHFAGNQVIFNQGDAADYLYILSTGKVIIRFKPYDAPPLTVATIQPGQVFGWSAALGRTVYTSGAVTLEASWVYRIEGSRLMKVREECPQTGTLLIQRLANVASEHQQRIQTQTEVMKVLTSSLDRKRRGNRRIRDGRS